MVAYVLQLALNDMSAAGPGNGTSHAAKPSYEINNFYVIGNINASVVQYGGANPGPAALLPIAIGGGGVGDHRNGSRPSTTKPTTTVDCSRPGQIKPVKHLMPEYFAKVGVTPEPVAAVHGDRDDDGGGPEPITCYCPSGAKKRFT